MSASSAVTSDPDDRNHDDHTDLGTPAAFTNRVAMGDRGDACTGPELSEEHLAAVGDLADNLARVMRLMTRARTQLLASQHRDWSSLILVSRVVLDGPQRVSALAETIHVDVSTASRQVASLTKAGLLERIADPEDGRASLLVATDAGREAVAEFRAYRTRSLAGLLHDWSLDDTTELGRLLDQLGTAVTASLNSVDEAAVPAAASHILRSVRTDSTVPTAPIHDQPLSRKEN